jgi:hypothetical protein
MTAWTTKELKEMRKLHESGRPTLALVIEAFPRHSAKSVMTTCYGLGLRQGYQSAKWIRVVHEYFMKREQCWAAYRYEE